MGYGASLTAECVACLLPLLADIEAGVRLEAACALSWKKDARCLPVQADVVQRSSGVITSRMMLVAKPVAPQMCGQAYVSA